MKQCVYPLILAVSLLCTGCVYYDNSPGGTLSAEVKSDLENVRKEIQGEMSKVRDEIQEGLAEGKKELEEDLSKIDWAKELLEYDEHDLKPKRILKAPADEPKNLTDVGPMEEFYEKADVNAWEKTDSLLEGLTEDTIFQYQQMETSRIGNKNTERYYTIARMIFYKDSNYVTVMVMEDLTDLSFGVIPKEYLTGYYLVPQEIIDALKAS